MRDNPISPGRCALVTGGASGIGLGIAQALLEGGLTVLITDVRTDHFDSAKDLIGSADKVHFATLDVTDRQQWADVRRMVETRWGNLHLLCLNAGVGVLGSMLESDEADWTWLTAVNLEGVLNGIDTFLPHFAAHRAPAHLVATSSMGGLVVANDGGIYSATKFGVVAAMESLRRKLRGTNVSASVLCPAAVNTNIFDHERMRPAGFRTGQVKAPQTIANAETFARQILSRGRQPLEVGRMVREAVSKDALYIFTDRNVRPSIVARRDALLAFA